MVGDRWTRRDTANAIVALWPLFKFVVGLVSVWIAWFAVWDGDYQKATFWYLFLIWMRVSER